MQPTRQGFGEKAKWVGLTAIAAVISAGVGGACGAVATHLVLQYQERQKTEIFSIGEDSGIAYPKELFELARTEGYSVQFNPPILENIAVCEYYFDHGKDWWQLMLQYLSEYPNCFIVRKLNSTSIEVLPDNRTSNFLQHDVGTGNYYCKCPPLQSSTSSEN